MSYKLKLRFTHTFCNTSTLQYTSHIKTKLKSLLVLCSKSQSDLQSMNKCLGMKTYQDLIPVILLVSLWHCMVILQYHHDAETPESLLYDNSWSSSTVTSLQRSRRPRDLAYMPQGTGLLDTAQGQLERYNGGVCWVIHSPRVQINWANAKSQLLLELINSWL